MENINIDIADYKTILSHKGKISGVVQECKVDDLLDSLSEDLKNSIIKAKGILVEFKINNNLNIEILEKFMGKINSLSNDSDIIFSTETFNFVDEDMISYNLLITGL